ncbi:MAG: hypothetical protein HY561_06615 [Gemmatimonadetes bacterium]|nr:hypothetical protein [Gemmatimonadota bacterium]
MSRFSPKLGSLLLAAGLALAGCGSSESGAAAAEARAAGSVGVAPAATLPAAGSRQAVTPGGFTVRVAPDPDPPRVGRLRLVITLEPAREVAGPLSVDLASPTMPMHGIVRVPADALGAGSYVALLEIPMEGLWSVYINLDDGAEAASFQFEVPAGAGTADAVHRRVPE